jgi:hypothetical protein
MSNLLISSPFPVKQTSPQLRVVRDEESPPYDAAFAASSERPAPGFGMIPARVYALNNGYAIAVYAALARHANRCGQCWPSYDLLCRETGWSKPTVRKAIESLKAARIIDYERRKSNQGDPDTNLYTLFFHPGGSKGDLPPSKSDIPGVVKDVDEGGKGRFTKQEPVNTDSVEQHSPLPPTGDSEPIQFTQDDFTPTYIPLLGELYRKLHKAFKELDPSFTDGWLRVTLQEAEREIGPLSYDALFEGVDAALRSVRRTLEAERKGGKPIGALTPYARRIVISTLQEQAHAVHAE